MTLKTNLDDLFSTDRTAEEDGIWVDLDATKSLRIRAFGAKAVSDMREKLMRPYQMMQRSGAKVSDEITEEVGLQVLAGAVIADWKGITGFEGEGEDAKEVTIPYGAAAAYDILKAMPRFANFVIGVSTDGQMYKDALRGDGVKN